MTRFPTILEAVDDKHLLGATIENTLAWRTWRAVLTAAFGLPMDDDALALYRRYTGREGPPASPVQFLWLVCGRRGGKTSMMALLAAYLALFRDWRPYLRRGERAVVLLVAQDRLQAQILHRYIQGVLSAPLLFGKVLSTTANEIELKGGVVIEVVSRNYRSVRGRSVCVALLDEAAMWRAEDSSNPDVEVFNSIRASMATFGNDGMMVTASSPYSRRGILWEAHRNWYGVPSTSNLVWQAPTWVMNPLVPQSFFDAERERDPENFEAEFGAQFRSDLENFLSFELVEAAVDRGRPLELAPVPGRIYQAFVDPSGGGADDYSLAISHREGGGARGADRVVVDVVRAAGRPVNPYAATADFAFLCKQYRINRVVGDRYAGEWPVQAWKQQGVVYEVSDMTASELFLEALQLFTRRAISLPPHPKLINQLRDLERVAGADGHDRVRHPKNGHDDLANVACGVARQVMRPSLKIITQAIRGGF